MTLTALNIHHLRNIDAMQLNLHPRVNFFYGPNGSGKTTILEAIYLLSSGRSFRTRETAPLIQYEQDASTIFARTQAMDTVSLQKHLTGMTQVRINQQPCLRSSDLARHLPCQLVYQDIFQIIDAGPSVRRAILDWGMFHVKHSYHETWREYKQVLKQRNALLRQKAVYQDVLPWDNLLAEMAEVLDVSRTAYIQDLSHWFQIYLAKLTNTPCQIQYYRGWDKKQTGKALSAILKDQFALDCQRQFTHSGPHQADILLDSNASKAKTSLSRGQQKIILIALKLAQAHLLSKPCIYLFDDVSSELDAMHLQRLMACLMDVSGQLFITAIAMEPLLNMPIMQAGQVHALQEGQIAKCLV